MCYSSYFVRLNLLLMSPIGQAAQQEEFLQYDNEAAKFNAESNDFSLKFFLSSGKNFHIGARVSSETIQSPTCMGLGCLEILMSGVTATS